MEYYSAVQRNAFESVLMRWMNLEPIIQSEVSQKDKYHILMYIYGLQKDGTNNTMCRAAKETQASRTDFWTQWEKARVGRFARTTLKHTHYHT